MIRKSIGVYVVALCLIHTLSLFAQTNDKSIVMDKRLRAISGDEAVNCGRSEVDGYEGQALECARNAVSAKRPFFVRFDFWGFDSHVSDGFAGTKSGNVYQVMFDSARWSGKHVFDDGYDVVEKCRKPVRIRRRTSPKGRFLGYNCDLKSDHTD